MPDRLKAKTAIVTGGAQGIGRAIVERFVAEGARVLALDINAATLAEVGAKTACETHVIDLTDRAQIDTFCRGVGDIDILCLCAGQVAYGTVLDCDERQWSRSFELNVTAMYRMIRALLPGMIARRTGSIITMSSVASSVRGVRDRFAYASTKAAVIGLTKALAADHVGDGIRCNAICPGTIETAALEQRMRASDDYAATRAAFVARQPIGRLGQAAEIAALATYLVSDEAAFTTGQCHVIDGGWSN